MRRYFDWLIPLLILMAAIAWRFQDGPLVTELRNKVFDVYQHIQPRSYDPKTPVRILAIDEESLKRIGQWPWPRETLARIIDRLTGAGAAVALDILLSEPDRMSPASLAQQWKDRPEAQALLAALAKLPSPDETLAKALAQGPVVVAFSLNHGGRWACTLGEGRVRHCRGQPTSLPAEARPGDDVPQALRGGRSGQRCRDGTRRYGRHHPTRATDAVFSGADRAEPGRRSPARGPRCLRLSSSNRRMPAARRPISGRRRCQHIRIGQIIVPVDANANLILYDSGARPERFIPIWKLLDPSFDPSQLAGNIVLIGGHGGGAQGFQTDAAGSGHGGQSRSTPRCSSRSSTASICAGPIG